MLAPAQLGVSGSGARVLATRGCVALRRALDARQAPTGSRRLRVPFG
jgi:hypothetical protein